MTEQVMKIQTTSVLIDPTLQPRISGLDSAHVAELQQVPESWPPLVVVEREGGYLLIDGFHRFAAAQNLELTEVTVQVVEPPADGDLHGLAFSLNAAHGRPLSLGDRRAYAARLLSQHPDWADREIGRRAGLSQPTVATVRADLEASAQIEQTDTRVGAGGYSYRVGTNVKQRQPGELPEVGLVETIAGGVKQLFTPAERTAQRKIVQYLRRLTTALEDRQELTGWQSPDDAAKAVRLVLEESKVSDLAQRLGDNSRNVLDVAIALGYKN